MIFKGFDEAVVIDVETTGFNEVKERVVSYAIIQTNFAVLINGQQELKTRIKSGLVNPQKKIPYSASRLHGISNNDVRHSPTFEEIAEELREFIGSRPIIAHNATFDKKFMNQEFRRAGMKSINRNKHYCTMWRYRKFNHDRWQGSRLENAASVLGIEGREGKFHEAEEDAMIALEIAKIFYLMDNGFPIPSGVPKPPK